MLNAKLLLQTLKKEWSLHLRHVRLLQAQNAALLSCDRDEFCRLHAQHLELLTELSAQKSAREDVLKTDEGVPCSLSTCLPELSARARQTVENVRDGLRTTMEQAQELTQRNTQLIDNELAYFGHMMDLYVDIARQPSTNYGASAPSAAGRLGLDRRA